MVTQIRELKRQLEKELRANGFRRSKPLKFSRASPKSEGYKFGSDTLRYVSLEPGSSKIWLERMFLVLCANGFEQYLSLNDQAIRLAVTIKQLVSDDDGCSQNAE